MDRVWKKQDEGKLQNSAFGGPDTFKAQPGSPPLVHTPQLCTCSPPTCPLPQLRPALAVPFFLLQPCFPPFLRPTLHYPELQDASFKPL